MVENELVGAMTTNWIATARSGYGRSVPILSSVPASEVAECWNGAARPASATMTSKTARRKYRTPRTPGEQRSQRRRGGQGRQRRNARTTKAMN